VKERIEKRHVKGRKAFRYRKWQVKRGEYDDSPPELSTMPEQAEWESVEKGSKLWVERRAIFWKIEAERMSPFFDTSRDLGIEEDDREREWKLRHLEIPFIRFEREFPAKGCGQVGQLSLSLAKKSRTLHKRRKREDNQR
jgi:hypothetical protein